MNTYSCFIGMTSLQNIAKALSFKIFINNTALNKNINNIKYIYIYIYTYIK